MTNDLLDELTTPRVPSRVLFNNLGPSVYRGLSYEECDSLIRFDNISDAIQLHDRWNVPFACYLEWVERQNFACSRRSSNLGLVSVEFSKVRSQEEVVNVMCKYGRVAFTSCLFENIKDGSFKMFIEYEEIDDAALAMALEEEYLVDMLILDSKARSVLFLPTKTDQSKSYDIDIQKVLEGLDQRTTCMIRNIPNKYTQTMLMEWLDGKFAKTYDFLYLRMDFRNHCNVGYAFINFTDYRRWSRFNSDKVCAVTYARIQGKFALIAKFRRSRVMLQAPEYRPKIFYSNGPLQGKEEPFLNYN